MYSALFIVQSTIDFDHYLPVIILLKQNNIVKPIIFIIGLGEEVFCNALFSSILEDEKITVYLHKDIKDSFCPFLDQHKVRVVIKDVDYITQSANRFKFNLLMCARDKKIPIVMMPHSHECYFEKPVDAFLSVFEDQKFLKPDILALCNHGEAKLHHKLKGLQATLFLGDPRYDCGWLQFLKQKRQELAQVVPSKHNRKDKIILYIVQNFEV